MVSRSLHGLLLLAGFCAGFPTSAPAEENWDARVRRLCTSVTQQDCWIKAGAQLCDESGKRCRTLEDHTPAKIIRKSGRRWQVETSSGNGWVSDGRMMVDGTR
jgi:hypothetical protein